MPENPLTLEEQIALHAKNVHRPEISKPFTVAVEEAAKLESPKGMGILESIFEELRQIKLLLMQQRAMTAELPMRIPAEPPREIELDEWA